MQVADYPLPALFALFGAAALLVWWSGSRLPPLAAALGSKTGVGQAFAGMLLLGGITSLPELATASSAAAFGSPDLALNNVLGSAAFNVLLLALADGVSGRSALTSQVGTPATLLQGVLGMLLLALASATIVVGDMDLFGVGLGSMMLFGLCIGAMWIASHYETRSTWTVVDPPSPDRAGRGAAAEGDAFSLLLRLVGLGTLVLIGGVLLSQSADAIADRTGIGAGLVGLVLLAGATSLPELSAVTAAVRGGHYELAIGDVFGANLFNVAMIFVIDAISAEPAVLAGAGAFEAVAALLALLLTGVFVLGLLERADRTLWRMGYDSIAAVLLYAGGVVVLANLPGG